jgi:hypothetical protein
MAEPPITEPRVEPNRRAKRRTPASPTGKLARMSSLTGILFAVLFVVALVSSIGRPRCLPRMPRSPRSTAAAARC